MKSDAYQTALAEVADLIDRWSCPASVEAAGRGNFSLLGFALNSETLLPSAILQGSDGELQALPPTYLAPAVSPEASGNDAMPSFTQEVVRHKKGGLYTRVAIVSQGDALMIWYISHHDGAWWLREKSMFEDGRFAPEPDLKPVSVGRNQ